MTQKIKQKILDTLEGKKKDEPYLAYRKEERLWELFVPAQVTGDNDISYWIKKTKTGLELVRVTTY